MKMMHVIAISGVAQLIAIVYLVVSVFSLESQLSIMTDTFNYSASHSDTSSPVDKYSGNNSSLSCELSNKAFKNELKEELVALITALKTDTGIPSVELAALPPDLERVENINSEVDYFLNDGEFSSVELNEIESKLIRMNYQERQLVLQKIAKAMTQANVRLVN